MAAICIQQTRWKGCVMDTNEWSRLISLLTGGGRWYNPLFGRNRFVGWIIRPCFTPGRAGAPTWSKGSLWSSANGPIFGWFNRRLEWRVPSFSSLLNNDPLLIASTATSCYETVGDWKISYFRADWMMRWGVISFLGLYFFYILLFEY